MTELLAILGFEDVDKKGLFWGEENGFFDRSSDLLMWDVPSVVGLDDLIVSDSSRSFQAMGIPPLPKVLYNSLFCCNFISIWLLKNKGNTFFSSFFLFAMFNCL